jgi:imidazolonepropionase-like amidohydrolase
VWPKWPKLDVVRDGGRQSLMAMREAGLPMAFGTDLLGQLRKYGSPDFGLMAQVLTPTEILRGMWGAGATPCRMEGQIGTLAAGARAHLVAFDADPFADIAALGRLDETLRLVVKDGVICDDKAGLTDVTADKLVCHPDCHRQ